MHTLPDLLTVLDGLSKELPRQRYYISGTAPVQGDAGSAVAIRMDDRQLNGFIHGPFDLQEQC